MAGESGQRGSLDPAFQRIPFDQWLGEHGQAPFRWTVAVPHGELSFHQRLMARLEIKVDGRGLESRRGDGELVFFYQITDRAGTRYQDHTSIQLSKLDENVRAIDLEVTQRAFLVPGDYRLAVGLLDTGTGEHSARQSQFRIASPHNVLADAWHDLAPVEFIGNPAFTGDCSGPPLSTHRPESISFSTSRPRYPCQDRVEARAAHWQLCFPR